MTQILDLYKSGKIGFQYGNFHPPIDETRFLQGVPLTVAELETCPREVRITDKPEPGPVDILYPQRLIVVSEKAKDVLEELEPDVHQFISVEVIVDDKYDDPFKGNSYFLLNVCQRIDAVDLSKSSGYSERIREEFVFASGNSVPESHSYDYSGGVTVVVKKDLIRGRHLWGGVKERGVKHRGKIINRLSFWSSYFCSDELMDAWKDADVGPMRYIPCFEY